MLLSDLGGVAGTFGLSFYFLIRGLIAIGCRQHINSINLEDVITLHVYLQDTCVECVDQPHPMFVPESIVAFGKDLTDNVETSEWCF